MEALLQVKNLSIGLHRGNNLFSSVEDLSFDVYPGEILGIVGESGSGKSLTALSIPGLLGENGEEISGSILYNGRDLLSLSEKELETIRGKEISMIFQEPFSSLNPLLKAGVQIAEAAELHELHELRSVTSRRVNQQQIKTRVKELLSKLKFPEPEKIIDTYPHRLSGGMCQRVMIALAVICKPRLLIADEPTTALDQHTQDQILALLSEINRDFGTSILFISHNLSLIKNFCSRVLVIYSGRILEQGSVEQVFSHPAHEYTKGLLGSIPSRENRGKNLDAIPGKIPSLEEGRPGGCPFHPRCGKALPECRGEFPPEKTTGVNHKTRCVLYGEN